ncbi:MAG: hypothetical protein AMJ46_12235 [Latescibacteria bacterium DG_63]|nr:MAG: hypothetical protein AMJ46_12235 [Latescibacteria bacterium DG_63]
MGAQDINLSGTILGELGLAVGSARIDGAVGGDIRGTADVATIANKVGGDVKLRVSSLTLRPEADIQGDLVYTSEEEAVIHAGAHVAGSTSHNLPEPDEGKKECFLSSFLCGTGWTVLRFFMALLTGIIMILLAPKWVASTADFIRTRPGPSVGWGLVILVVVPIVILVACITVIGIPIGLIGLALYLAAVYVCQVPVSLFVGKLIVGRFRSVESRGIMIAALALGLIIVRLLRLVPYLGFLVGLAVLLFGMGALVVSARKVNSKVEAAA